MHFSDFNTYVLAKRHHHFLFFCWKGWWGMIGAAVKDNVAQHWWYIELWTLIYEHLFMSHFSLYICLFYNNFNAFFIFFFFKL